MHNIEADDGRRECPDCGEYAHLNDDGDGCEYCNPSSYDALAQDDLLYDAEIDAMLADQSSHPSVP